MENLDLMLKYGPDTWKLHNKRLEVYLSRFVNWINVVHVSILFWILQLLPLWHQSIFMLRACNTSASAFFAYLEYVYKSSWCRQDRPALVHMAWYL